MTSTIRYGFKVSTTSKTLESYCTAVSVQILSRIRNAYVHVVNKQNASGLYNALFTAWA